MFDNCINLQEKSFYNRDNFIDYYCHWDQNLQTSFSFWDTIGYPGNSFNNLILECLRQSDVAVIMYDLSQCVQLEKQFVDEYKDEKNDEPGDEGEKMIDRWWKQNDSLRYLKDLDSHVCCCCCYVLWILVYCPFFTSFSVFLSVFK